MNQKFLKQRLPLGSKFEELIIRFLGTFEQLQVINTGALKEHLEKDLNTDIWKQDQFKKYKPLLILRWFPDLMIINDSKEISLFADVKFMYTPIYLDTLPKQISENTGIEIKKYDIEMNTIEGGWNTNQNVRPDKDWEKKIGRSVSYKKTKLD